MELRRIHGRSTRRCAGPTAGTTCSIGSTTGFHHAGRTRATRSARPYSGRSSTACWSSTTSATPRRSPRVCTKRQGPPQEDRHRRSPLQVWRQNPCSSAVNSPASVAPQPGFRGTVPRDHLHRCWSRLEGLTDDARAGRAATAPAGGAGRVVARRARRGASRLVAGHAAGVRARDLLPGPRRAAGPHRGATCSGRGTATGGVPAAGDGAARALPGRHARPQAARQVRADRPTACPTPRRGAGDGARPNCPRCSPRRTSAGCGPSSMGLSFAVPADVDVLAVTAVLGALRPAARPRTQDRPDAQRLDARAGAYTSGRCASTASQRPDPAHQATTRRSPECCSPSRCARATAGGSSRLTLVNAQQEPDSQPDTALAVPVAAHGHRARRRRRGLPARSTTRPTAGRGAADDPEELHLRLLYRDQRRFAFGRNVAVARRRCAHGRAARLPSWRPPGCRPTTCPPPSPPVGGQPRWPASSCRWTRSPTADAGDAAARPGAARRRLRAPGSTSRQRRRPGAARAAAGRRRVSASSRPPGGRGPHPRRHRRC